MVAAAAGRHCGLQLAFAACGSGQGTVMFPMHVRRYPPYCKSGLNRCSRLTRLAIASSMLAVPMYPADWPGMRVYHMAGDTHLAHAAQQ